MKVMQEQKDVLKQDEIKKLIEEKINQTITIVEYNKNSKKILNKYIGKITEIYKNLFIVKLNNGLKKSFCYVDFCIGIYSFN